MSWLCLVVALGSALPTADMPAQARTFGVGETVNHLSISLFMLGFGLGPLVLAPRELVIYI